MGNVGKKDFFWPTRNKNLLFCLTFLGDAVLKNLLRRGFNVVAITDVDLTKCNGYDSNIEVKRTNREVTQMSDVVISG